MTVTKDQILESIAEMSVMDLVELVKAIEEKRQPLVSVAEGRKAVEIVLAAYESAKTGRVVKIGIC